VQNFRHATVLKCQGRLVRGEETSLLCAAVRVSETAILDMSGIEAVDAAGIGVLVSLQAAGVYLTLLNPSESVRNVLCLTGVDSIFAIAKSLNEALAPAPINAAPFSLGSRLEDVREPSRAAVPLAR
jgi:anti-anti-sigma factor